ncbi:hypothetical protein G0Q06_11355 [Puniceicoccales bacterium CK1056]|uniref:Sulfotransferase domain-containing protein n=1 Tax=Oceanipulchritudo coccoides TaxID=2706888 RepID=A0A6B2M223_9BACT|nr:hypothetical protein [Oceanipulchritudo coccoides]NDV63051.1 hypothetical protein [Oceanipulchritudo coccoides]
MGDRPINRLVRRNSELVIEGYPRCANSFAVKAFRQVNDPSNKLHIGTHTHSPANIIMAIKWKVPTVVLIREPEEAILSKPAKVLEFEEIKGLDPSKGIADKGLKLLTLYWTRRFSQFYQRLEPWAGQFVAANFETTTRDFPTIINQLNDRYGKNYKPFYSTDENNQEIFKDSSQHLFPSKLRDHFKEMIRGIYHSEENAVNRQKAEVAYQSFLRLNHI